MHTLEHEQQTMTLPGTRQERGAGLRHSTSESGECAGAEPGAAGTSTTTGQKHDAAPARKVSFASRSPPVPTHSPLLDSLPRL